MDFYDVKYDVKTVKVNIGGTIFETTETTLRKMKYFDNLVKNTNLNTTIIFVDRQAHIFKHVLALVIDENYKYPIKYEDELDFYGVQYYRYNLYNPWEMITEINKETNKLNDKIDDVLEKIKTFKCMDKSSDDEHFCKYVTDDDDYYNDRIYCGKRSVTMIDDEYRCYDHS